MVFGGGRGKSHRVWQVGITVVNLYGVAYLVELMLEAEDAVQRLWPEQRWK